MASSRGYSIARAQSIRDAEAQKPKLTVGELLDVLGAFAEEFVSEERSKKPANFEVFPGSEQSGSSFSAIGKNSSCASKSNNLFDCSPSSVDDFALMYAEIEDMEVDREVRIAAEKDPGTSQQDQVMDETDCHSEASVSSCGVPSSLPTKCTVISSQPLGPREAPVYFRVMTDTDGRIMSIASEIYDAPYQYNIDFNRSQVVKTDGLNLFMQVVKQEQSNSAALIRFITGLADSHFLFHRAGHSLEITWLPTLIRNAVFEIMHDQTTKFLTKWLLKTGFATLRRENKLTASTSKLVEMVGDITRYPNEVETYLLLHGNNMRVDEAPRKAKIKDITDCIDHRRRKYHSTHALLGGFDCLTHVAVLTNTLMVRKEEGEEEEEEEEGEEEFMEESEEEYLGDSDDDFMDQ